MPSLSLDDDNRSLNSKIASSREQSVSCDRFSDCTFHAQRKGCTRFRNYDLYFLDHFISLAIILDQNSIHMSRCCSVSLARGLLSFAKTTVEPELMKLMTAEWPPCSKNVQRPFDPSDRPSDNNSFQRSPLQPERRNVMFCAHATSTHSRLRSCIEIKSTHGPAVRLMCIAETSSSISFFPSVSSLSLTGRAYVSVSVRAGSVEYGRVSRRQVLGLRMCYGVFSCDKLHVCSHITSHSRVIL